MSDNSSLGGLGSSTPRRARGSAATAGPSSKPAPRAAKRRKRSPSIEYESGNEGNPVIIEGEEDVRPAKSGAGTKAPTTNGVNAKGKGKEKATRVAKKTAQSRVMDIDGSDEEGNQSELKRLRQELEAAQSRTDQLSRQVEEMIRARQTEPEALFKEYRDIADKRMEDQQTLIDQLTLTLAKTEPLMKNGKSNVLQLLTREAADEEQRILERERDKYKRQLDEQSKTISDLNKRTSEMEQELRRTAAELDAEVKRSKALATQNIRPPGSAQRHGRALGSDDPKYSTTIKFYEDLTDLLVTNVRFEKCKFDENPEEDSILSCVYTYTDKNDPGLTHSLTFTLRLCHDEDKDAGELVPQSSLDFLAGPFSFRKEQLQMFTVTLSEQIGKVLSPEEDEEEVEVEIVGD
ncbi:hypothetical protein CPB85DRAFT_1428047 [Mucidula mucida]|nr:hypothetical protein CPB85DRAFT_1428047 [Mucidula mucida]